MNAHPDDPTVATVEQHRKLGELIAANVASFDNARAAELEKYPPLLQMVAWVVWTRHDLSLFETVEFLRFAQANRALFVARPSRR